MSRKVDLSAAAGAPMPNAAGEISLEVFHGIASLYGGRTVASAAMRVGPGLTFAQRVAEGERLLGMFLAALDRAGLELDVERQARPRITYEKAYTSTLPGQAGITAASLLLLAHVRIPAGAPIRKPPALVQWLTRRLVKTGSADAAR